MDNIVTPYGDARAIVVFDTVPEGCETFTVRPERKSNDFPAGTVVVVDPAEADPQDSEMFLLQWSSGARDVVEVRRWLKFDDKDGGPLWTATWVTRLYNIYGQPLEAMRWGDGPYPDWAFREKLIGRVVGIYSPTE